MPNKNTTKRVIIEMLQQHFPDKAEIELLMLWNRAKDEFFQDIDGYKTILQSFTTADTRYYFLSDPIKGEMIKVFNVKLDSKTVPRILAYMDGENLDVD